MSSEDAWSIVEVARHAGVTSRTLRHYDSRGLLPPAYVGSNGYRYYRREQLQRLQEVLVLRELDVPLEDIARILDGSRDRLAALRGHRDAVLAERDRLTRLAVTIERTIEAREEGRPMNPEELFAGFDADRQREYESELVERYGAQAQDHVDESWRRIARMGKADAARVQSELASLDAEYAALLDSGVDPGDTAVQTVTAGHFRWVCQFWTPDADAFAGLGDLYVEDERFRARYEAVRPGLAQYVREAMAVYATAQLA
jgi:MerR family transcriptional regulator, thiopeptide resistance regulator